MKMEIAKNLIKLGAVKLSPESPFTYASGLKGPIYCDNRLILSHVEFRNLVIESFIRLINSEKPEFDLIGGIATAGIPYAAFVADRLNKPMVYVRGKAKNHGKKNQVEGDYKPGQKVILFEDLVNQASSLIDAMNGIREAELVCNHCFCVVDYQMNEAIVRLNDLSTKLHSLTDFDTLLAAAFELNMLDSSGVGLLEAWHADPKKWSDNS